MAQRPPPRGRRWLLATIAYAAVAAGLGAVADSSVGSTPWFLVATGITLPVGLAALVGVYIVYGLLAQLASLPTDTSATALGTTGGRPLWFLTVDDLLVTLLFAGAAVANALIVAELIRNRRTRRTAVPRRF